MTTLSNADLSTLRTRPQRTKLYLSIFQPRAVFKARLNNASAARGDRVIPYNSVTLGSVADVEVGMTLWVGSSDGAKDLGKIRIRSIDGTQITVSENSNILWANGAYLTGVRFWEVWPIFPRIIQNPSNAEDVIFYKDYDIPYSNQNSILGTLTCIGSHQALFAGEQVYYSNTGTLNLIGSSLSHSWFFEGASVTGSSSATPGFITYPNAGHYVTRYIVSGSSGAVDTTYRYVSVYDRPGEGSNPPIEKWEVSEISASRDEGGYRATFKVWQNVPIDENSVIVLFSEDWYGYTKQSFGGNSPNNERIFFAGYVLEGSIHYNYSDSTTEFEVGSITEVMKSSLGFSVSVESKASPAKWYELLDMDCRRAMYHYLKWHTTVLSIADFQFMGSDQKIQFFDADRASMFDAIDNLMRNSLVGKAVADRQGKIWAEVDAKAYTDPLGSFPPIMEISKIDWMGEPSIDQKFSDRLSYYEAGGIAYSGVNTGTFSAILACAPGPAPSFRGTIETPDGLALAGQPQLNILVGNIFANANSRLPSIEMDMAINARNIDVAPQQTIKMNILPTDTIARIEITGSYVAGQIGWRYDPLNQILLPSIGFEHLTSGPPGETVAISEPSDFDSGFSVPQIQVPPLPALTIPAQIAGLLTGTYSSSMVNSNIENYQADYARVAYSTNSGWQQETRGATVLSASVAQNPAVIRIQVAKPGLYHVSAYLSYTGDTNGVDVVWVAENETAGIAISGDVAGDYGANGSLPSTAGSADMLCSAGNVIKLTSTSFGGNVVSVSSISLSVVRISA